MPDEDLSVGAFGDRTRELHAGLTSQGFEVSPAEQQRGFFGPATLAAVRALQQANGLTVTGVADAPTLAALSAPAPAATATAPAATATVISSAGGGEQPPFGTLGGGGGGSSGDGDSARVAGTIVLEHGSPASTVKVRLYQRGLGGGRTLLNEVETDQRGGYEIPYSAKGSANIELYAVGPDGSEVQLSQTKFGAQAEERLDLIAPSALQPPAAEFIRLKAAVAAYTGNRPELLKDAVEQEGRRDFSYLASTTGWDAGALALASRSRSKACTPWHVRGSRRTPERWLRSPSRR
jgi:hypothetical protein